MYTDLLFKLVESFLTLPTLCLSVLLIVANRIFDPYFALYFYISSTIITITRLYEYNKDPGQKRRNGQDELLTVESLGYLWLSAIHTFVVSSIITLFRLINTS